MAKESSDIAIHVVSVDIIVSREWGDISKESTRAFWLRAAEAGWVIAVLSGPPCNTWSRARHQRLHDQHNRKSPRPVRHANHLWGLPALAIRELCAVLEGNLLLGFSLQLMVVLATVQGYGFMEHPAEPSDEHMASIWRLPVIQMLLQIEGFHLITLAQGLFGAASPKPTSLLTLNLPQLRAHLHAGMITKTLPAACSIGVNEAQEYHTTSLKEYPPGFCRPLAVALFEAISARPCKEEAEPDEQFLARCMQMTCTEYGQTTGLDTAK